MSEDEPIGRGEQNATDELSRRTFLRLGALACAGAPLAGMLGASAVAAQPTSLSDEAVALEEATIAQLQDAMTKGGLSSLALVNMYLERISSIDEGSIGLNSV